MDFSQLQASVNDNVETSQFTNWTAALTKRWINRAVRWACEGQIFLPETNETFAKRQISHDFSFLINEVEASTVDGQRTYLLPDGTTENVWEFRKDKNIELIDYNDYRLPLLKFFKRDIEDDPEFRYLIEEGVPSHFCIEQSALWLFPLPDHSQNNDEAWSINMEYYAYLPELSDDADTNIFTLKFADLLEFKASSLGFGWAKDTDSEKEYEDRAIRRMIEIITNDQSVALGGIERGCQPTGGAQLGV
jgi:hypothetical protein